MGERLTQNYEVSDIGTIVDNTKAKARVMVAQATTALNLLADIRKLVDKFDGKVYNVKFDRALREAVHEIIMSTASNCYMSQKSDYSQTPTRVVATIVSSFNFQETIKYIDYRDKPNTRTVSVGCFYPFSITITGADKRIDADFIKEQIDKEVLRMQEYINTYFPITQMEKLELVEMVVELNKMTKAYNAYIDSLPRILKEAINYR